MTKRPKNKSAVALSRLRWKDRTQAARSAHSRAMHDALTPEQRTARARRAAIAMHKQNGHKLRTTEPEPMDEKASE